MDYNREELKPKWIITESGALINLARVDHFHLQWADPSETECLVIALMASGPITVATCKHAAMAEGVLVSLIEHMNTIDVSQDILPDLRRKWGVTDAEEVAA